MVETIAPVVYGRMRRYWAAVVIHSLSATITGTLFGSLLALIGIALGAPWQTPGAVAVAAVGVVYALREVLGWPVPLFDRRRQVPDWWRTFYPPHVTAALYGAGLGIGFLTFLRDGTYVVVCVIALTSGDVVVGALLGGTFGFFRGITTVTSARSKDEREVTGVVDRIEQVAVGRGPRAASVIAILLVVVVALMSACARGSTGSEAKDPDTGVGRGRGTDPLLAPRSYARPVVVGRITDPRITESSGLVASRSQSIYWTHNDSDDGPFIYALNREGRTVGVWRVRGADAFDWEDIAIRQDELYVGDIGDNDARRRRIKIYRFQEPSINDPTPPRAETLTARYPDGRHDAEALFVHPESGDLYIITKDFSGRAGVYAARAPLTAAIVLERIARLSLEGALGGITGADLSPDGYRVALSTYSQILELTLEDTRSSFDSIWRVTPTSVRAGYRSQGEAVAYTADGAALITTSEGIRPPLHLIRTTSD